MSKNSYYVLLDAMGIQRYVFDTNRLKVIIGASQLLEEWLKNSSNLCRVYSGTLYTSAGGNVLARFEDKQNAETFKDNATSVKVAPPGMEIAWAIVQSQDTDSETWSCLQREIARYKAGDRDVKDYGPYGRSAIQPPAGCRYCGIRPANGTQQEPGIPICAVCEARYKKGADLHRSHASSTPMEMLYQKAAKLGMNGLFPEELDILAAVPGTDEHNLIAVCVIDLNNMGGIIQDVVRTHGFVGLQQFAASLQNELAGILCAILNDMLSWPNAVNNGFFRFRPLLFGGDDIVVVLPAPLWPIFVETFFEKIKTISIRVNNAARYEMSACAGIAVAKHTFPISRLAAMAEELTANAKGYVRFLHDQEKFALDWHVHQESALGSIGAVRSRKWVVEVSAGTKATATRKPYTLTEFKELRAWGSRLAGLSNRKLFTLYQALKRGPDETRDALVYTFLRDDDRQLGKYAFFWEKATDGHFSHEFPLWKKSTVTVNRGTLNVHSTCFTDMLELKFMLS